MVDMNMTGKRIAALRHASRRTQQQLAFHLNVTGQAVSKWENGHSLPDTALLDELAQALGATIDYLLTGRTLGV